MNPLADHLRERHDDLIARGVNIRTRAINAGWETPSTMYAHLKTHEPYRQFIRADVLDKLAIAFETDRELIGRLAAESTVPSDQNPLQMLVRAHMIAEHMSLRDLAAKAGVSVTTLHNITANGHTGISDNIAQRLARALGVPFKTVRQAADKAIKRETYRLPAHVTENLTPERWKKILKAIEVMVDLD